MSEDTYSEVVFDRGKFSVSTEVQRLNSRIVYENGESYSDDLPLEIFCDTKNVIGSTKTSKVYSGKLKNNKNGHEEEVAVKELKDFDSLEKISFLKTWLYIKHINIIELKGYCPKEENKSPLIIMEYGKGGLLRSFLKKLENYLPLNIIIKWGIQIADGMIAIHEKNIVHKDLASGNIVMTNSNESIEAMEETIMKIIDINDDNAYGTPLNMAPEAFDRQFTKKSDVYSFGSLLWEMKTSLDDELEIFDGVKLKDINMFTVALYKSRRETFNIPEFQTDKESVEYKSEQALINLIQNCWIYEPNQRPDFQQVKKVLNNIQLNLLGKDEEISELQENISYYQIPGTSEENIEQDDGHLINLNVNFNLDNATIPTFF